MFIAILGHTQPVGHGSDTPGSQTTRVHGRDTACEAAVGFSRDHGFIKALSEKEKKRGLVYHKH